MFPDLTFRAFELFGFFDLSSPFRDLFVTFRGLSTFPRSGNTLVDRTDVVVCSVGDHFLSVQLHATCGKVIRTDHIEVSRPEGSAQGRRQLEPVEDVKAASSRVKI